MPSPIKQITLQEEKWSNQLGSHRAEEFKITRSYVRYVLSDLFRIPPLEVPLTAPPGKAPELKPGFGHISFSHCDNALLIGWAPEKLGVDIEDMNRSFKANEIAQRYFTDKEKKLLRTINKKELKDAVLDHWVAKEAAIKWQRGSINIDLPEWEWESERGFAIHNTDKIKVNIFPLKYHCWSMAVAIKENSKTNMPILCLE